ncbi:MAG: hypothetical protein FRX48_05640 [Lasallia pustulata]|uniref:Uncharacterized protein n=1 Tax=Lasallia pustulata TaxID=136370 RepID=A0A5M8PLG2_9LECA|nr:MAG: hypothetical protein FRX48_05640 [Lasallia pustulata]
MLDEAYSYIIGHLALEGDSLVPSGTFTWRAYGFSLQTWNANNHQTTWSVLQEGVGALRDYMATYGYGT